MGWSTGRLRAVVATVGLVVFVAVGAIPAVPAQAASVMVAEPPVLDQPRVDVPVGDGPTAVMFTPDSRRAFVLNSAGDSVSVVDVAAASVVATVAVPAHPVAALPSPDGRLVFVTSSGVDDLGGALSVIDVATNRLVQQVPMGGAPAGLAIRPGTVELWVGNASWGTSTVFDWRSRAVLRTVPTGLGNRMVFSTDGSMLYFARSDHGLPAALGDYVVASGRGDSWYAASDARQVAFTPDGVRQYWVTGNSVEDPDGRHGVLQGYGGAMTFRPDGSEAFVLRGASSTYPARVARMDARRFVVTGEFAVGSQPQDLKVSPDGSTLLTANYADDTASLVRLLPQAPPAGLTVDRVGGADRYAVSAALSRRGFPSGASIVYVASGEGFADALSAAPAAAERGGPVLLTAATALPAPIRAELVRLRPARIIVVGGAGSVSAAVRAELGRIAPVTGVGGADRYATSRAVIDDAFGTVPEVFVAAGENFPDALSAAAAAAKHAAPVLLVRGTVPNVYGTTDADIVALTRRHGITKATFVGGPASLSAGAKSAFTWTNIQTVHEVWGRDRFATSVAVNADVFDSAATVYVASGMGFPDALGGSALAASTGSPLYVIRPDCLSSAVVAELGALHASRLTVVGGPAAVSTAVEGLTICR